MSNQAIKIKQIGADDASLLARLQTQTFVQAYADVHSPEDIETYCTAQYSPEVAARDLLSEETVCCLGFVDSEPSGYYMVKHQACPITFDSDSSELKQIYVLSAVYGSGLGLTLYEHALATIRSVGHGCVWLCVSDINCRAQAFYEKLGFSRIADGPVLAVGKDTLSSSILVLEL